MYVFSKPPVEKKLNFDNIDVNKLVKEATPPLLKDVDENHLKVLDVIISELPMVSICVRTIKIWMS